MGISSFTRLKGIFRSNINLNNYDEIIKNTSRKIIGNLPDDLLNKLIKRNPELKKEAIKSTQFVFDDVGKVLGEIDTLETQAIMRTEISESSIKRIIAKIKQSKDFRYWKDDPLYAEKELETLIKAEETLLNGLKTYLPETNNVAIKPLGSGQFGNAYKIEIFDKDSNKIIADKVIKNYRSQTFLGKIMTKMERFFDSISDEELYKNFEEFQTKEDDPLNIKEITKKITKERIPAVRRLIKIGVSQFKKMLNESYKYHGVAAEANSSEYLKYFAGHKISYNDGIEIPDMFNLGESPYCISSYIDKVTHKASKKFNFERLGLSHEDFDINPGNGINGICIDMGGIIPLDKTITSSKEATRIIKRIKSAPPEERKEIFNSIKSNILSSDNSPKTIKMLKLIESQV